MDWPAVVIGAMIGFLVCFILISFLVMDDQDERGND